MKSIVVACVASLTVVSAFAGKVCLKSGSSLTGEVVSVGKGEVVFKSDDLGEVKIKTENIVKLDAGEHVVRYQDNTEDRRKLSVDGGRLVAADGKPLDLAAVKAIDPKAETWHGNIDVGFLAARGNTYDDTWSVVGGLNRRWEKDRFVGGFGYYYSRSGKADEEAKKTTDRWEADLKHDHFWLTKVYHYEQFHYDRDMIQNLRGRYRLGLGGGYQWLENSVFESTGKWSFNQEVGVNWIKEDYEDNPDAQDGGFAALRYAHHLNYIPKWHEGLEFFHNFEWLPEVDDWDKYLVKADVGLSTKLIYDFDLLTKIQWDMDSKPAPDRKKSDVRYIIGLGYKW